MNQKRITLNLIWKVIKTFAGFGSVNDKSICLTKDVTGVDFHDYPVDAGGDGTPDHFKQYECSICKHKYTI